MKKIFITIILCVLIIILTIILAKHFIQESLYANLMEKEILQTQEILKQEKYIIHAGGYICDSDEKKYTYTNSKESLLNCYKSGYRVCEIDFDMSKDNHLICIHDWEKFNSSGYRTIEPVDLETFLAGKIQGKFTPMWLKDIADFMQEHDDFYVVTDIKSNNIVGCKIIAEYCPELMDNFIIQIYHEEEYDNVVNLGFKNIIYTLYKTTQKERSIDSLQKFAEQNTLVGFTFWNHWADNVEFLNAMKKTNVPLFVHTVNDKQKIKGYFNSGITGIYTDLVEDKHN